MAKVLASVVAIFSISYFYLSGYSKSNIVFQLIFVEFKKSTLFPPISFVKNFLLFVNFHFFEYVKKVGPQSDLAKFFHISSHFSARHLQLELTCTVPIWL